MKTERTIEFDPLQWEEAVLLNPTQARNSALLARTIMFKHLIKIPGFRVMLWTKRVMTAENEDRRFDRRERDIFCITITENTDQLG